MVMEKNPQVTFMELKEKSNVLEKFDRLDNGKLISKAY